MTRTVLGLVAVFALIVAACVAFGAFFASVILVNAYREAVEARFAVTADRLAAAVAQAAGFGIALPAQTSVAAALDREARIEPALHSIDLTDAHGAVVFSSDPRRLGVTPDKAPHDAVVRVVRDDLDRPIGRIVLRYDPRVLDAGARRLRADLWRSAGPAVAGAFLVTLAVGLVLMQVLGRAVRRAADPARWPPAARAAFVDAQAVLAAAEAPPHDDPAPDGAR